MNADIGLQVYNFDKPDTSFLRSKGFKTSIEGRLYPGKLKYARTESNRNELYIGIQFFYRHSQATNVVSYSPVNDSTKRINDYFGSKITAKGINFIFGIQLSAGRFVLEPYAGIGIIGREVTNSDIEYDKNKHFINGADLSGYFQSLKLEESSGTEHNILIGFRLGYRL